MKLPVHLNALRAFEASARHQSFSLAAEELNVTPAAVGQLVRSLEEVVGYPLFHRSHNRRAALVLTEPAQRALPDIRMGFQSLNLGMTLLREGATHGILNVTISPAFAAKWLLPRIEDFQQRWPDIDVRLETSLKLLDFTALGMDVGMRFYTQTHATIAHPQCRNSGLNHHIVRVNACACQRQRNTRARVIIALRRHDRSRRREHGAEHVFG
ncbi:LysR family transcriptional regulator [Leclercia adecarboxylata]|uniref:LysR family transcriptional regulator n=1 Tax=Leclercia adecarboxylata TaxID=83655 RepID=UPI00254BBCA8|nr:LysR family transcriptional regulator [Leclercia adecarboxylata]